MPTCAGDKKSNDCKACDWSNNTFEGKEPSDLVRRDIVEGQADKPIYEIADHKSGCDIGGFRKLVRNITKPWPDSEKHGFCFRQRNLGA